MGERLRFAECREPTESNAQDRCTALCRFLPPVSVLQTPADFLLPTAFCALPTVYFTVYAEGYACQVVLVTPLAVVPAN